MADMQHTAGELRLNQPRHGYRFSQDALLLADFVELPPAARVVDLGTGCGVVALRLARKTRCERILGIEIQPELAHLAHENACLNGLGSRVEIICQDMRSLTRQQLGGAVDTVVSNPPFRQLLSGRLNPDIQNAIAHHELKITLAELVATARELLSDGGRLVLIYTSDRLVDLLAGMRRQAIEPKRLQVVHASRGREAQRVLVEGVKKGRNGLTVLPPLFLDRPPF